jgi:cell wall-associated NlpC family hydrolase
LDVPVTRRRRPSAWLALLLAAVLTVSLAEATGPASAAYVASKPPPNPTNGQINNAQQEKAQIAAEIGRLGAEISRMQTRIRQLQDDAEMAEQKYAWAVQKLQQAKADAVTAKNAVTAADARVAAAQKEYNSFVAATYMSGDIAGTTGSLLTAEDPNVVLQQSALEQYESDHQLDAIGNLRQATVARSNADAAARTAVLNQQSATAAADQAKTDAINAVQNAQVQQKQLQTTLAANRQSLIQAQRQLATLNHQRAAFIAYQRHQAELRRKRRLARIARERAAREAAARERRREARIRARERAHSGGGGGGGGSAPVHHNPPPPAPNPGSGWSAAKGQAAAARAKRYLGWMYAWAGGNASGPTYGVCAGDGAWNDCHVRGFDCSGLSLYAWAPYIGLPHFSAAQYYDAGSVHPSISGLMPGDLVFWSSNGTVGGIHHVAIYIGGGNVIQAPQSGSVIQITPLSQVDWGYYGATRPLT